MPRTGTTVILALGLLIVAACGVQNQKPGLPVVQVPAAVKQTFHDKFPQVPNPGWSLKTDHNYEAEFLLQQVEMAVKIDPAGKWLETETTVPLSAVPPAALSTVNAQFHDYKIIETQTLQRPGAADLTYEVHLDNGAEIIKAELAPEGAILDLTTKPKPKP